MKKSSFLNILRAIRAGRCRERRYADHIFIEIYFRVHNAPFRSQIFKIFFALGSKGSIDPLTRILQTPLFTLVPPGGRTPPLEVRESRTRGTVELYERPSPTTGSVAVARLCLLDLFAYATPRD